MKSSLLRKLMLFDAAVLLLLGLLLIFFPGKVELAFQFKNLPAGVDYILGLWGCVLATLGLGYAAAATNPLRHLIWAQMGIARGLLECVLGLVFLARGLASFQQAGFGIILAAMMTVAYLVCYPRRQGGVQNAAGDTQP
jgi:hypothetical protein